MNEPEHVFPLPDLEIHKLEEVEEEILHPRAVRLRRYTEAHHWGVVTLFLVTGVISGLVLGRRK